MSNPNPNGTPPLTLEQYARLHLLGLHVGHDALRAYAAKYNEVLDAWARIYPPGKALAPGKDLSVTEKRARLLYSGDGRDLKLPRVDFHDFQRRWQFGTAELADLARQVEQVNEILALRKEEPIAPLPPRTADSAVIEGSVSRLGEAVAGLRETVADLARHTASLHEENAGLREAVTGLTARVDALWVARDAPPRE